MEQVLSLTSKVLAQFSRSRRFMAAQSWSSAVNAVATASVSRHVSSMKRPKTQCQFSAGLAPRSKYFSATTISARRRRSPAAFMEKCS